MSRRSPEERKKDVDNVLNWLRNGQHYSMDPTGEFKKIDQMLPQKRKQSPKDRARDIEGALDWMRNNGVSPFDDDVTKKFEKLSSVPISRRTPEAREKDVEKIMNWLRNGKLDSEDPTGDFKKIDQLLPKKKKQLSLIHI